MTLTLYLHPLSSFCHKVLIALYENETPFESVTVDYSNAESKQALLDKWPVGKIPVLYDSAADITFPETSIIIEYLQLHYPGAAKLLPDDAETALQTRLWDRFFDLYVQVPMQKIVSERTRPEGCSDPHGAQEAHTMLDTAYTMIEKRLSGRTWISADHFSMADCAATPALFYASIVHPFGADKPNLDDYFERLMQRPSVVRTIREARPYFQYFPYKEKLSPRFLQG